MTNIKKKFFKNFRLLKRESLIYLFILEKRFLNATFIIKRIVLMLLTEILSLPIRYRNLFLSVRYYSDFEFLPGETSKGFR